MRSSTSSREILAFGALAGIAGGAAEMGWISLYGTATGIPLGPIARGIAGSVGPAMAASPWAVEIGILIHLGLAIALGISLALAVPFTLRRLDVRRSELPATILILAAVWAVNFLLVLPLINPAFVHLLPYAVTLFSKLLFGFAAAVTFRARRRLAQIPARSI